MGEIDIGETIKSNIDYWKDLYFKEKEKNENAISRIEYYLVGNTRLDDFDTRNKELRKLEKLLEGKDE